MSAQPLDARLARLEGSYEQLDHRLGDLAMQMHAGFSQIEARLTTLDSKFDTKIDDLDHRVNTKIDDLDHRLSAKIDSWQWRVTALVVGTWIATIGTIVFRH